MTMIERMEDLKSETQNKLLQRVLDDAIDKGDDDYAVNYFTDVLQHGCQSGTVSGLIYYKDTHAFFDEFYEEIQELYYEISDSLGTQPKIKNDLKNWFAWFGYEEMVRKACEILGTER